MLFLYTIYMKKVENRFTKYGMQFKQIKRVGNVAIFEQSHPNWRSSRYEVVKIGHHNGYYLGKAWIEPAETYPGASLWGLQGWTFTTLEEAMSKYKVLCTKANKKQLV